MQATYLLGLYHLNQGQPAAGALTLRRLRDAGPPADDFEPALSLSLAACWLHSGATEQARQSLVDLRKRRPAGRVMIAGRDESLANDDARTIEWFQGIIGRPFAAAGTSQPTSAHAAAGRCWAPSGALPSPTIHAGKTSFDSTSSCSKNTKFGAAIPTLHALPVGNVLLLRTLQDLLAVDFRSGKKLWEVPPAYDMGVIPDAPRRSRWLKPMIAAGIEQQIWDDLTHGTLTSDGRRVYSVEDVMVEFDGIPMPVSQVIADGIVRSGTVMIGSIEGPDYFCNRLAGDNVPHGQT